MIRLLCVVLLAAGSYATAPQYVQSKEAFAHAQVYIGENLPPQEINFEDPEFRKHHAFGDLAGVVGGLVKSLHDGNSVRALEVLDEVIPNVWLNYNAVAQRARDLLEEAAQKISSINSLIESACPSLSPNQCNEVVNKRVHADPETYEDQAHLLLSLGEAAKSIIQSQDKVDNLVNTNHEIPYLLNNVEKPSFQSFIGQLNDAYSKMRSLQFRRSYWDM